MGLDSRLGVPTPFELFFELFFSEVVPSLPFEGICPPGLRRAMLRRLSAAPSAAPAGATLKEAARSGVDVVTWLLECGFGCFDWGFTVFLGACFFLLGLLVGLAFWMPTLTSLIAF